MQEQALKQTLYASKPLKTQIDALRDLVARDAKRQEEAKAAAQEAVKEYHRLRSITQEHRAQLEKLEAQAMKVPEENTACEVPAQPEALASQLADFAGHLR